MIIATCNRREKQPCHCHSRGSPHSPQSPAHPAPAHQSWNTRVMLATSLRLTTTNLERPYHPPHPKPTASPSSPIAHLSSREQNITTESAQAPHWPYPIFWSPYSCTSCLPFSTKPHPATGEKPSSPPPKMSTQQNADPSPSLSPVSCSLSWRASGPGRRTSLDRTSSDMHLAV